MATTVLFSDLGNAGDVYNDLSSQAVCGAGACIDSYAIANPFTVPGSGTEAVTQIDLAVGNVVAPNTFYLSIWTDISNVPNTEVAGTWVLTSAAADVCCDNLVTDSTIAGVNLNGGQTYFLVLTPADNSDDSYNEWFDNSTGVDGAVLLSVDGGGWTSAGSTLSAFDVLGATSGVPEPESLLLFGTGLIGMLGACLRWGRSQH